jgi:hypothetical protein
MGDASTGCALRSISGELPNIPAIVWNRLIWFTSLILWLRLRLLRLHLCELLLCLLRSPALLEAHNRFRHDHHSEGCEEGCPFAVLR